MPKGLSKVMRRIVVSCDSERFNDEMKTRICAKILEDNKVAFKGQGLDSDVAQVHWSYTVGSSILEKKKSLVTMNNKLLMWLLEFLALTNTANVSRKRRRDLQTDMNLVMPDLVSRHGYPIETHTVTSSDGYIQTLHRIPKGKTTLEADSKRIPVLIHHALLCSSVDWIIRGPGNSLGYILADAGYDVWLANARGNTYSKGHVSKNTSDPDYWDFSWHEIGFYDLPAAIDHILDTTGHDKLFYIGFSMGTSVFFVTMSEHPEYSDKVRLFVGLGPVATFYVPQQNAFIELLSTIGEENLERLVNLFGVHEFMARGFWLPSLGTIVCREGLPTLPLCSIFMSFISGDTTQTDISMLPVFYSHTPAGASAKEVLHFGQQVTSRKFRQYDHGPERNMQKYGLPEPPEYNLNATKVPVALFYSDKDLLATAKNVEILSRLLPNVILNYRVPHNYFNHLDFMWGRDANTLVYPHIIELMRQN